MVLAKMKTSPAPTRPLLGDRLGAWIDTNLVSSQWLLSEVNAACGTHYEHRSNISGWRANNHIPPMDVVLFLEGLISRPVERRPVQNTDDALEDFLAWYQVWGFRGLNAELAARDYDPVSRQKLSHWRKGRNKPQPPYRAALWEILSIPPASWDAPRYNDAVRALRNWVKHYGASKLRGDLLGCGVNCSEDALHLLLTDDCKVSEEMAEALEKIAGIPAKAWRRKP